MSKHFPLITLFFLLFLACDRGQAKTEDVVSEVVTQIVDEASYEEDFDDYDEIPEFYFNPFENISCFDLEYIELLKTADINNDGYLDSIVVQSNETELYFICYGGPNKYADFLGVDWFLNYQKTKVNHNIEIHKDTIRVFNESPVFSVKFDIVFDKNFAQWKYVNFQTKDKQAEEPYWQKEYSPPSHFFTDEFKAPLYYLVLKHTEQTVTDIYDLFYALKSNTTLLVTNTIVAEDMFDFISYDKETTKEVYQSNQLDSQFESEEELRQAHESKGIEEYAFICFHPLNYGGSASLHLVNYQNLNILGTEGIVEFKTMSGAMPVISFDRCININVAALNFYHVPGGNIDDYCEIGTPVLKLNDSEIIFKNCEINGSGYYAINGSLGNYEFINTEFYNHSGSILYISSASLKFTDCTFYDNNCDYSFIESYTDDLYFENCYFSNNTYGLESNYSYGNLSEEVISFYFVNWRDKAPYFINCSFVNNQGGKYASKYFSEKPIDFEAKINKNNSYIFH